MGSYEYFYPGTPSILEKEYSNIFQGYQIPNSKLGATTSINTANQLKQVGDLMKQGIKNIEVSLVHKKIFDQIPHQHMKEIANLAALNKAEISLHAPFDDMTDPSGFTREGRWSDENRQQVERELLYVVKRGQDLNTSGDMPIVFHSSALIPGSIKTPEKDKDGNYVTDQLIVYDYSDKQLKPVKRETIHDFENKGKEVNRSAEEQVKEANEKYWTTKLDQIIFRKHEGDRFLEQPSQYLGGVDCNDKDSLDDTQKMALKQAEVASEYVKNAYRGLKDLFSEAMNVAKENNNSLAGEELRKVSADAYDQIGKAQQALEGRKNPAEYGKIISGVMDNVVEKFKEVVQKDNTQLLNYIPVETFAKKNTSETFSNVAFEAYKEFGSKAPVMAIENPPYGGALSSGKELKELIEMSRSKFAEKLVEKKGLSESEAKKIAERTIGATWDTVHISAMKKHGFENEHIMKETEAIAPFVKHVHLNDSLGGSTDDVVPGMGDVQIKETLEAFKNANKDFAKTRKIFEGGAFFAQWQTSPQPMVLEAMGSPIQITGAEGMPDGPTWNRVAGAGNQSTYYSGMGDTLPDYNFQSFGAGFTGLPTSLGGQMSGARGSRFSGTPMA